MVWLLAYVCNSFTKRHDVNMQPRGEGGTGCLYACDVTASTYPISTKPHKHTNTILSLIAIDCVLLTHFHYITVQLNAEKSSQPNYHGNNHTSPPSVLITVRPHYRRCARRRADDINSCLTTDNDPRCAAHVSSVKKLYFLFDRHIYLYDYINAYP